MRFEREAKTLASLNHPNIAAIYGIEHNALVMELVEGEDLSAHIARGPIPLAETQVAYNCREGNTVNVCVRALHSLTARRVAEGRDAQDWFFSPDGEWIGIKDENSDDFPIVMVQNWAAELARAVR